MIESAVWSTDNGHGFDSMLIGHDSGECAKGYIMSSNLPNGVHAIEWSPCSRNALQAFLADR